MFMLSFFVLLPLVSLAACAPDITSIPLNTIAKQHRKLYFGTATNTVEFVNDTAYRDIIRNNKMFGQITAANSMKWVKFQILNRFVQRFLSSTRRIQSHRRESSRSTTLTKLSNSQKRMVKFFVDITAYGTISYQIGLPMGHLPSLRFCLSCDDIVVRLLGDTVDKYSWDVINEVINDDGTFREDVFFNSSGTKYIATAFHAAHAADPFAKLYANDFNIEGPGPKSTAYQNLIETLKKEGVPIHGLGIQSHLVVGELPVNIKENLEAFTKLGIEVALTELDIRMTLPETPALLAQQKKDYETIISACNEVKGCIGITIWDFTDKYSWVPGSFAGEGDACPWDDDLQIKPAYFGIIDGFSK
ncbi:unnamed protein product [Somion occarium]|uniref:Beta-xylanase n=1 Tax=Somion occarium TaxID=3059160 RepID=A0ABP1DGU6_9APHY